MKIAVSSTDKSIENEISSVFGRCPFFIIVDIKDGKIERTEVINNNSNDQNSGAGIATAKLIVKNNIDAVITGHVGPRALDILNQFNVEIYSAEGIIKDVLQAFIDKKLQRIN